MWRPGNAADRRKRPGGSQRRPERGESGSGSATIRPPRSRSWRTLHPVGFAKLKVFYENLAIAHWASNISRTGRSPPSEASHSRPSISVAIHS